MAARPTWKGYLKVGLVNIPVRVFPATDSAATRSFNQLHTECQNRIQQKRWYPTCETEVAKGDLVKGYEFEKGRYVILNDDYLTKVRPESTRVINLVRFMVSRTCARNRSPTRKTWASSKPRVPSRQPRG